MTPENRLKMTEICTRYFAKGTDEQVEILRFYVGLGLSALQDLESSKKKVMRESESGKPKEEKEKPNKKGTTTK